MDWKATDKTCVKIETGFINLLLLVLGSDIDSLSILILFLILTPGVKSESVDKIVEAHTTSTRNKKTTSISGNNFFMVNKENNLENDTNMKKVTNSKNLFKIFHQNIRGLKSKVDELSNSLPPDCPHTRCLTQHHLKYYEIDNLPIDHFKLGSQFCRHEFKNGGVGIFIHEDLEFLFHLINTVGRRILRFVL